MFRHRIPRKTGQRRGAILVLAALFTILLFGMMAFAVDIGYIALARTQLQVAADSAALAGAASLNLPRSEMEAITRQYASANSAASRPVELASSDIEYGTWDTAMRIFTPSATPGNAVRVTARAERDTGGEVPLFFGRIYNVMSVEMRASAVATTNPRDIAFVVDLSGSMNQDTNPDKTDSLNRTFASEGYPTIGTQLMQQIYDDFDFGTFPGVSQPIGKPLGVTSLSKLSDKNGPLSSTTINSKYRILSNDNSNTRTKKAYSWAMDVQIPQVMPKAKPTPNSANSTSYNYWLSYLEDHASEIGYRSYMKFMIRNGRDQKPDGKSYTPLSQFSDDCPWHAESTAGGTFNFPPREQPTHAARRAIIAALQVIKERNQGIYDPNQRDWVSIITFDRLNNGGPLVAYSLDSDYTKAMEACTLLQACNTNVTSTATEAGLILAASHIKPTQQGGKGRLATNKVVVLLTDGQPNLYSSSNNTISKYMNEHRSDFFYGGSNYARNAALMQTAMMQRDHWSLYPVGIGLDCDYDFMDRMASMGATADQDGRSPRGSGNPGDYEQRLTEIFLRIITNPKLRLVK